MPQKILVTKERIRTTTHFKAMHLACAHLDCSLTTLKVKTDEPGLYYAKNLKTGATCSFAKKDHKVIINVELVMNMDIDKDIPRFRLLEDIADYFGVSPCAIKRRCELFSWIPNYWAYIEHKDGRKAYYRRRND
jgi:hypothetical protein